MTVAKFQPLEQGVAQGLIFQAEGSKTQVGHLHHSIPQVIVCTLNLVPTRP